MTRFIPLAIVALGLGACSSTPPQTVSSTQQPIRPIVTNVHPYFAGNGTVQAVYPTPMSAAAGGSAEPLQRLEIKMDNGKVQYVDTSSREFAKGTRVVLTDDRLIKRM